MSDYSFDGYDGEKMARVYGRDLPISTKHAIEICSFLRKQPLAKAKTTLEQAIAFKRPIPFKRFTNGYGHKRGMATGAFPIKASKHILILLNSVEANAQQKGLNTAELNLTHMIAQKASRPARYSRHRGRQTKRTHVEIVVQEVAVEKKAKSKPKPVSKETPKPTPKEITKPEVKKTEQMEQPKQPLKPEPKKEVKQEVKQTPAKEDKK